MVTTVLLVVAVVLMIAVVGYLVGVLIKSIRNERRRSGVRKVWANYDRMEEALQRIEQMLKEGKG